MSSLSPREIQVAVLVAQGLRRQQIAEQLGIAPNTVRLYVNTLYRKFGVVGCGSVALYVAARKYVDGMKISLLSDTLLATAGPKP